MAQSIGKKKAGALCTSLFDESCWSLDLIPKFRGSNDKPPESHKCNQEGNSPNCRLFEGVAGPRKACPEDDSHRESGHRRILSGHVATAEIMTIVRSQTVFIRSFVRFDRRSSRRSLFVECAGQA